MEKQLSFASLWLGIISIVLTLALRLLAVVDVWPRLGMANGAPVSYMTFYRGAVMFLLLSIAAGLADSWKKPRS